jgi:hypothetical protein
MKSVVTHNVIQHIVFDMIISPFQVYHKWAQRTHQTEHPQSGYAAQHIVSVLIDERGTRSAARGSDLVSGSEIKTCSRVGQTDTCTKCRGRVYKTERVCPHCASDAVRRNQDSKWLFTVHSQEDVDKLCQQERILLFLEDYPEFESGNFKKIRLQLFEICPSDNIRHGNFRKIIQQYYDDIYCVNKTRGKRPAPKNFWPYTYEFYMCLPVLTFHATIENIYTADASHVIIEKYIQPEIDRRTLEPERMPKSICTCEDGYYTVKEISEMSLRIKKKNV